MPEITDEELAALRAEAEAYRAVANPVHPAGVEPRFFIGAHVTIRSLLESPQYRVAGRTIELDRSVTYRLERREGDGWLLEDGDVAEADLTGQESVGAAR